MQDEIAEAVTIAIAPAINEAERQRAMRKPPQNLDAWAAYQRGLWHIGKATAEDTRLAHDFFQRATELDPRFAGGYIGLASAISAAATAFGTASLAEIQSTEESLARPAAMHGAGDHRRPQETVRGLQIAGGDDESRPALANRAVSLTSSGIVVAPDVRNFLTPANCSRDASPFSPAEDPLNLDRPRQRCRH